MLRTHMQSLMFVHILFTINSRFMIPSSDHQVLGAELNLSVYATNQ